MVLKALRLGNLVSLCLLGMCAACVSLPHADRPTAEHIKRATLEYVSQHFAGYQPSYFSLLSIKEEGSYYRVQARINEETKNLWYHIRSGHFQDTEPVDAAFQETLQQEVKTWEQQSQTRRQSVQPHSF